MAKFSHEAVFEAAYQAGEIPGVALVAADATGKFKYEKSFGKTAHGEPFKTDSVVWMASCTKLMTTVAALQQVQRGHIGLDEDVGKVLPEVAALKVLKDFDAEGKPIFEDKKELVTLRKLLSHASGLTMGLFSPKLQQLEKFTGPPANPPKDLVTEFSLPLVFQPGKGWQYGTSLDWAGKLVERVSGLTLEEYMKANIWGPLNMHHITFAPDSRPETKSRKVGMTLRDKDGKLHPTTEGYLYQYGDREDAYGGAAGWGSAESYLNILQSLCANDGRVLSKELVEEMFRPQLGPEGKETLNNILRSDEESRRVLGNTFDIDHQVMDYGLGGEIGLKDEVGRRQAGTMSWGGLPNLIWWIDRKGGLCGALFTNLIPVGDAKIVELMTQFELSVYEQYEEFKKQ
ncbi:beta-lactamase/transpeptidase-like protein [Daldinia decipiens]|uniref:beta-lactamase/transpeptidase-like protein n=1 Tax=Daldinia decipiens TaxID=326647 RepID=UPI0020C30B22|nr:beta-lactamase/transpeptidase-like protein [Daldinia decipiens]KAI1655740.1 beta-lactamase/transpeptidase-like protein [Daldinia decipiens]